MLHPSPIGSSALSGLGVRRVILRTAAAVERLQLEALQDHLEQLTGEIRDDLVQGERKMQAATRRDARALAEAIRKDNLALPLVEAWPWVADGVENDLDALVRVVPALEAGREQAKKYLERIRRCWRCDGATSTSSGVKSRSKRRSRSASCATDPATNA
jgi:hypothetical protein